MTNINQDEIMEVLTSKISASNQIKDLLETLFIACGVFLAVLVGDGNL